MEAKVFSVKDSSVVKTKRLQKNVFGVEVNENVIYDAVKEYLNNQRQGTHSTKTRVEVSGGGRKPWRQKGLGRARAGTIRSPLWVGGGVTFGPKPRDYYYKINKKARKNAIKSALTLKAKEKAIFIITDFIMEEPKTKIIADLTKQMELKKTDKKLFVFDKYDVNAYKSIRNIEGALPVMAHELNTFIIMNTNYMIITEEALKKINEVFGK